MDGISPSNHSSNAVFLRGDITSRVFYHLNEDPLEILRHIAAFYNILCWSSRLMLMYIRLRVFGCPSLVCWHRSDGKLHAAA